MSRHWSWPTKHIRNLELLRRGSRNPVENYAYYCKIYICLVISCVKRISLVLYFPILIISFHCNQICSINEKVDFLLIILIVIIEYIIVIYTLLWQLISIVPRLSIFMRVYTIINSAVLYSGWRVLQLSYI